jgi:hypothetical protein
MATTTWTVVIGATTFTSNVLSLSLNLGRQTMFDDYAGGSITITLRNNTNQCGSIAQGETIKLQTNCYFYVTNIAFNEGMTDSEATCTVTGADAIAGLSQYALGAGSGASTSPTQQMYDQWISQGIQPPYMDTPFTAVSVVNGIVAEDTTIINQWNLLINSEMGSLVSDAATIYPYPYSYFKTSQYTFGRSGTTGIPYYSLNRMSGTSLSANNVIVDWVTGSSTYLKPSATYKRTYTKYGVLANSLGASTQSANQAQFYATIMTDPTTISGELSWTDKAASTSNNNGWMSNFWITPAYMATLEYKIPGASATSTRIKIEGVSCNATPDATDWTVYFSDGSFYDDYILDSASGTLGLSRFGWQL